MTVKNFLVAIVVMVGMSCSNSKKNKIALKFDLEKGSRFEQTMSMNMQAEQQGEGPVVNSMAFTYLYKVTGDSSQWKKVIATITRVKIDVSGIGETMHYDSDSIGKDSTQASLMAKVFGSMKGTSFYFTINDQGQVGEVGGVQELRDKMNNAMADDSVRSSPAELESFRQNIQQAFAAYPPYPVAEGDSWKKTVNMTVQGLQVVSENAFILKEIQPSNAVVHIESEIRSDKYSTLNNMQIDLEGSSGGDISYDRATGMPMRGNLVTTYTINLKNANSATPMKMKMVTTLSGKKL